MSKSYREEMLQFTRDNIRHLHSNHFLLLIAVIFLVVFQLGYNELYGIIKICLLYNREIVITVNVYVVK
jgi:hypothetical protein